MDISDNCVQKVVWVLNFPGDITFKSGKMTGRNMTSREKQVQKGSVEKYYRGI